MKKIYILASGLIFSLAGLAQYQTLPVQRAYTLAPQSHPHTTINHDRAPGDVISTYEDDFSIPANWNLANTGSPATNFTINSTGSTGSFAPPVINSTSGGNFAWYDCDPQGDGSTVDATLTYGTVMDLTGFNAVSVSFEQYYVDYYEDTYVEVSVNGMAGPWTQYEVNEDYLPNSGSPTNPVQTLVNVSALAGNQASVAVRFHYVGGWGWSWQIDDFAMVEAYEHDLSISQTRFTAGTEGNEYYMIPTTQITAFTFGALIKSNGVTTQTNTYMHVQVDGGTEYDEVSGQTITLAENVSDSFSIESPNGWTPSGVGTYDLEMIAITDDFTEQLPINNTYAAEPITVGGVVYARDNGVITGSFSGFTSTAGEPLQIGNTYEFFGNASFGKVHIGLTSSTASTGQLCFASVYKYDDGVGDFVFVTSSADYEVTSGDLGTILEFNLDENIDAVTGDIYLVCAGHYGGSTPVAFAEAQPALTGTVLAQSSSGIIGGTDPSAVIVRAVFEPTEVSVIETEIAHVFTAYPNPANDMFTVQYNLVKEGNVSLTITDLSGKIVSSQDFGTQTKGEYKTQINTANIADGVYFYTLTVDGVSMTKKMTVSKN